MGVEKPGRLRYEEDYIQRDRTDGCIAVTNDAMDQIWKLVKNGTPVEILP